MLRRVARSLVLVVLLAGLTAAGNQSAGADAPAPERADRVGVVGSLIFSSRSDMLHQLRELQSTRVHWLSETFYWAMLEPARGHFDWRRSDALMSAAARTGTQVLAVLAYSAPWASSDPTALHSPYFPPRNPADYAQYATAVVQRYGPGGSFWAAHTELPAVPLQAVAIWNEPWWQGFWRPRPDPVAYATLVRTAGASIRRAQPSITILASGDLTEPNKSGDTPWLDRLLGVQPSVGPYVDAWSIHPYPDPKSRAPTDGPIGSSYQRVPVIAQLVAASPVPRPLWITEIGWSSTPHTPGGVTTTAQAHYLQTALEQALTAWRSIVTRTFIYAWGRDGASPSDLEAHFTLFDTKGHAKPALAALKTVTSG
jgi:hypothetical protein